MKIFLGTSRAIGRYVSSRVFSVFFMCKMTPVLSFLIGCVLFLVFVTVVGVCRDRCRREVEDTVEMPTEPIITPYRMET